MFYRRYAEKSRNRDYATSLFDSAKDETTHLRKKLEYHADENDAWDEPFMQGFTFLEAIEKLKEAEREIFTVENREGLESSFGSGINFENLVDRLEKHRVYLTQIERALNRHSADD